METNGVYAVQVTSRALLSAYISQERAKDGLISIMSLPNATRDTTDHPSKNAVPAPVDRSEQAADVDRKVSHPPIGLLCLVN
jgi:hypothetical protein